MSCFSLRLTSELSLNSGYSFCYPLDSLIEKCVEDRELVALKVVFLVILNDLLAVLLLLIFLNLLDLILDSLFNDSSILT